MHIEFDADYVGQRQEKWEGWDTKRGTSVRRNWLSVALATDDGEVFTGRLGLPDGEVSEAKPLAVRGDRVRVSLIAFANVKGATVATLSTVCVVPRGKK